MTIYIYPLIHSLEADKLEYIERAAVHVDKNGTITQVERLESDKVYNDEEIISAQENEFLIPGFVDTHAHAPQFANIGYGFNLELLDWLHEVTFPTEANYEDVEMAQSDFSRVVAATLSVGVSGVFFEIGTTTCSYYSSLHLEATKILATACHNLVFLQVSIDSELGQRALVGKVNMDQNCPEYYRDQSAEISFEQTKEYVDYVKHTLKSSLVHPVITPRFAICCSPELLSQLGDYIKNENLHMQTHLSENKGEIDFTLKLYPNDETYTHIYANRGLLTDKTILAHCCHLSDIEIDLIKKHNSGISHCPTSNFHLRSGITDVDKLINGGLEKIGLGSDCSAGYEMGILQTLRTASTASKALAMVHEKDTYLRVDRLFYLATLGGARVLDLNKQIGNFLVGKQFDALIINPYTANNRSLFNSVKQSDLSPLERLKRDFERYLFAGTASNIQSVIVDGKFVLEK
ncbi:Metallo-dependent hydrolase [Wallemia mellicola]|nr:Metallo-dependent hydrolase [Wallemia mellicola]